MGRAINELASYFLPTALQLLVECEAEGIPCRIVDTGRSDQEQVVKLEQKVSWTPRSKHQAQPPEGKSEAIDIVPVEILNLHKPDWDVDNPLWTKIGLVGERLGLEWGGRWTHVNNGKGDPSHFQYVKPKALSA